MGWLGMAERLCMLLCVFFWGGWGGLEVIYHHLHQSSSLSSLSVACVVSTCWCVVCVGTVLSASL